MEATFMDLCVTQFAAASNKADTFHSAAEWETWRPLITQLYFTEDKTLKMVQKILADDYGFHATERMFKRRIHKWKLDKNNKEHEMKAVVHTLEQRRQYGRSPLLAVRNSDPSVLSCQSSTYHDSPPLVGTSRLTTTCSGFKVTPTASSQSQQPSYYPSNFQTFFYPTDWIDDPLSSKSEEVTANTVIDGTRHFYFTWADNIRSFRNVNCLCKASFVSDMSRHIKFVLTNLQWRKYGEAFKFLNTILEGLRRWAKMLNPIVLLLMLCFVMELDNGDMQPVAQQVLSYLASLSNIAQGPGHPIRTVSRSLLHMAGPERSRLVRATLCNIYGSIGQDGNADSILIAWAQSIGTHITHHLANGRSIRISSVVTRHHRSHDADDFSCCIHGALGPKLTGAGRGTRFCDQASVRSSR
ncbi:hypothetical protein EPUS_07925 [Endocarpon pusillum Z07020]|uniref:Clr5 domain-containing protein n=1 Tax=Endocarpon pusillum (strain Z07020 / HMAS-L-300199) TaxID=1263415 RepID=U1GJW8_ENDPU|nr:uncharacterized protein EPUS_07925 [Endocarpon pusillum Z07020]ERF72468.1 hypothetical protein EPUS_07925 [Endocarpon pusillum Z07020]